MAEIFQGTPIIVNVAISGPDGRKVEYNICGRDLSVVKDAVRQALECIPSDEEIEISKPAKARKPRRTKAEMSAANEPSPEIVPDDGIVEEAPVGKKKKTAWPE